MAGAKQRRTPDPGWQGQRLVEACLAAREGAWDAIVDKYKNLVYSIVLEYGVAPDEAADVFQSVWLDAYTGLAKLRKKGSVKSWLISLTLHKCYHWKQGHRRRVAHEPDRPDVDELAKELETPPDFVEKLEQDQLVRQAVNELPSRCREMIDRLFFRFPPMPYKELAQHLGLATGSIGFIRGRCLQKLRKILEKKGL